MADFIVRRPGTTNFYIDDLNQTVIAGGSVDLLDLHDGLEISNSFDLKTAINNTDLIRVKDSIDIAAGIAFEDLFLEQAQPQNSSSVAESEAELALSLSDSVAERGQSLARLGNSIARELVIFVNNNSFANITKIAFNIDYTLDQDYPDHQEGLLFYDRFNHTLAMYCDNNEVMLQIGQEIYIRVRNNSGSLIPNGSPVYITGVHAASGNLPTVEFAQANSYQTSRVIGLTTHDLSDNETGYITCLGVVRGVNTSAYTSGTRLYLSDTVAGGFLTSPPQSPAHKVGVVTVLNQAVLGDLLVRINFGDTLLELSDVDGNIPSHGYILEYDESNGYWNPQPNIASEAESKADYALSYSRTIDTSLATSYALIAESIADYAGDRASEATSIAERAASLSRVAVETSDISEAASIGQDARSIALLAESNADYAVSISNIVESETEVAISIARRAESQGVLDNSIADYGVSIGNHSLSIARLESIGVLVKSEGEIAISIARLTESEALLTNSIADYANNRSSEATSIGLLAESLANLSSVNVFGTYFYNARSDAITSNSTTTLTQKLSISIPTIPAGGYNISWYFEFATSSTSANFLTQIQLDNTTTIYAAELLTGVGDANIYHIASGFDIVTLTNATHTFDIDFATTSNNKAVYIKNARFKFWRVS